MDEKEILLPQSFLNRMKVLLKGEYRQYEETLQQDAPKRGIRLNPLKADPQAVCAALGRTFGEALRPSPFSPLSCYLPASAENVGRLALHHAGAFYVQEPSASSAVTVLAPKPGERILDLCAAPGGKSTQIAALLGGRGLLWSNEIMANRAQILLSNFERMGVRNGVVSSCHPETLCSALAGFFDRVLVDAPCSGEGMFRKDGRAAAEWSEEHVASCAVRQQAILNSARQAVREGGVLVYSTCTFSPEENEGVVTEFLRGNPEFVLEDCGVSFGRPAFAELGGAGFDLSLARRIFPMDGGEGHFVARLRRIAPNERFPSMMAPPKPEAAVRALFEENFRCPLYGTPQTVGEKTMLLPDGLPELRGLGVLRAGVLCCEAKKNRLEPAHALFAAAREEETRRLCALEPDSAEAAAFLRGEEIPCAESGFTGVSVGGVMLGFGKASGGMLKNRYPKGLRNLK
ncbi:MAG: RsmB/NOP family class I SAM-dependent RNA methyltransferase [Firmicutes bacterium]|nr:RsmB/NOP family class I SAM-dependent RNA methyltransferase [Bacillota bacterium]